MQSDSVAVSSLGDRVINAIWHAFDALQCDRTGFVHKSKLKVLTANIGTLLDMYGIEKGLDHFRSTSELEFEWYRYYLQEEVFLPIIESKSAALLKDYEENIEEVCWLVCHRRYSKRQCQLFPDSAVYKLFRVFCFLADLIKNEDNPNIYQVLILPTEAKIIADHLINSLGLPYNAREWDDITSVTDPINFSTLLSILEGKCYKFVMTDEASYIEAINEIYQTFIKDVIKKGYLMKKGYLLPTLREFWCVIQPREINYYKSQSEKILCGTIELKPSCSVEIASGTTKPHKFYLMTGERPFEFATQDHKSRLQWVSALQLAIRHSEGPGYQREQRNKRFQEDKSEPRIDVEQRTKILELEEQNLALKDTKLELERLLEEETQAKRDEEIVRALQARVLAEEWEKREELEKLQEEQRQMLAEETLKRKQFEELQRVKEQKLKEAENRLRQIEKEREKLDNELKIARNKAKQSEHSQKILEEQLIVMYPNNHEVDKIRRAVSFMPSMNDKTAPLLQARAATLRKHSKNEPKFTLKLD